MKTCSVITSLEEGDEVGARLHRDGELILDFGADLTVWVYRRKTPEVFADLCERFDLQEEADPGSETEGNRFMGECAFCGVPLTCPNLCSRLAPDRRKEKRETGIAEGSAE